MANYVGPKIKEARTAAGMTQEQLSKKVKTVTAADISKAERGEKELTQAVLKEIAKATGVTQTSLIEAAKKSTYGSSTASSKATASKPASSKSASSKNTKASDTALTLTSTERNLVSLYRKADSQTKKAAMELLKGELTDITPFLPILLNKAGSIPALSGLSGLSDLLKKK